MPIKQLIATGAHSRQMLTEQRISDGGPGTILTDVRHLIEFIGPGGLRTQSNRGNLPSALLPELNERLSHPIDIPLRRPLLRDYPNLAGLYVLLRVMDLVRAEPARLSINEAALTAWSALNPTEQYFALVEAWLLQAEDDVLGPSQRPDGDQFGENVRFLADTLSPRWGTFDEFWHTSHFRGGLSTWNIQLQIRFGLIEVQPRRLAGRTGSARGWLLHRARRTPWGEAVAWAMASFLKVEDREGLWDFDLPEDAGFGFLQAAFRGYFPEWQTAYAPTRSASSDGLCVFKISLDQRCGDTGFWFRLLVPGQLTLEELADAILKAVKFEDTDHLYEYRYRDRLGKARRYYHAYCDEGPYAFEVTLSQSELPEKQAMRFRFDFGDDWRFHVRLERIDPPNEAIREPTVIASAGEPPQQYPHWQEP